MIGKYLNGYEGPYVPPGWDRWFATYLNGALYDYAATDDGVIRTYGSDPADYGTAVVPGPSSTPCWARPLRCRGPQTPGVFVRSCGPARRSESRPFMLR